MGGGGRSTDLGHCQRGNLALSVQGTTIGFVGQTLLSAKQVLVSPLQRQEHQEGAASFTAHSDTPPPGSVLCLALAPSPSQCLGLSGLSHPTHPRSSLASAGLLRLGTCPQCGSALGPPICAVCAPSELAFVELNTELGRTGLCVVPCFGPVSGSAGRGLSPAFSQPGRATWGAMLHTALPIRNLMGAVEGTDVTQGLGHPSLCLFQIKGS